MIKGKGLATLTLALLGALPLGCASDLLPKAPNALMIATTPQPKGSIRIQVRIPQGFRTKANPGYTAADVTSVVLRVYAKNASHGTYDYEGGGTVLFTSSGYAWTGGVDGTGNNRYTIANLPISGTDYIVTGHAFKAAADITKTVGGFGFARSANSVNIAAGATSYSDAGSALSLQIPLQDGVGGAVNVNSTVVDGAEPVPVGGDAW